MANRSRKALAEFIFPYDGMIRIRFAGQGMILAQSQPEASDTPKKVLYAVKNSIVSEKAFVKSHFLCYTVKKGGI